MLSYIAFCSDLFPNISLCYRAIEDRQAIAAIFKVLWSLLSVKALKLGPQSCNRGRVGIMVRVRVNVRVIDA